MSAAFHTARRKTPDQRHSKRCQGMCGLRSRFDAVLRSLAAIAQSTISVRWQLPFSLLAAGEPTFCVSHAAIAGVATLDRDIDLTPPSPGTFDSRNVPPQIPAGHASRNGQASVCEIKAGESTFLGDQRCRRRYRCGFLGHRNRASAVSAENVTLRMADQGSGEQLAITAGKRPNPYRFLQST